MINNFYSPDQIIETKELKSIPRDIYKDIFDVLSLPETPLGDKSAQPFGSFLNRVAEYFGDVDLNQKYIYNGPINKAGQTIAKLFQTMVSKVNKKVHIRYTSEFHGLEYLPKRLYFSEVKAGIDSRFKFDYGTLEDGVYRPSTDLIKISNQLYHQKLLTKKEIQIINHILNKPNKNGDDYDIITNLFRDHYILRWTVNEILKGSKIANNKQFKLSEAVLMNTPLKIDLIIHTNDNLFLEFTNFYRVGIQVNSKVQGTRLASLASRSRVVNDKVFDVIDEHGHHKGSYLPINFDPTIPFTISLQDEIEHLYYSNLDYSPFKLVKRAFAFLKHFYKYPTELQDIQYISIGFTKSRVADLLGKYTSILTSSIGILYSIKSELSTIALLLERNTKFLTTELIEQINDRIDYLVTNLSNVLEIDEKQLSKFIEKISYIADLPYEKGFSYKSPKLIPTEIELINNLIDEFQIIINYWTITYFNKLGLNPPQYPLVPGVVEYDGNIIRTPNDNPKNPLKEALEAVK